MVFGWFVSRWEKSTMLIKQHKSSDGKLPPADTLVQFLIVFPVGERWCFFRFWRQVQCVYLTEHLNRPHQKHAEAICLFLSELLCLSFSFFLFFCFYYSHNYLPGNSFSVPSNWATSSEIYCNQLHFRWFWSAEGKKRTGEIGRFNSASFIFSYLPAKKDHFSFHIHSLLPRQDLQI